MKFPRWTHSKWFTILSIAIGGSALVSWVGYPIICFLTGNADSAAVMLIAASIPLPALPCLSALFLWWGGRTLRDRADKKKCLIWSLILVVLLSPVLLYVGAIYTYAVGGIMAMEKITADNESEELSAKSPNGRHIAIITSRWTAGGWGQSYYVSSNGCERFAVGGTSDQNYSKSILWSPDSSMVIFVQEQNILAAKIRDQKTLAITLDYALDSKGHIRPHPLKKIEFLQPNVFLIVYNDGTPSKKVQFGEVE